MSLPCSYDFARFEEGTRAAELRRLELQSTLLLDRELSLVRAMGLGADDRLIDIGSGPGFVTGALSNLARETIGLEPDDELRRVASELVAPRHERLAFRRGLADATGLPAASADFIYARFLYQHLPNPLAALCEARRVLAPGGRVCVLDVDDGWATLHPTPPPWDRLRALVREAQARQGGDREIGRKLPGLLAEAGFTEPRVRIEAVTSLDIGLAAFVALTTGFKLSLLPPELREELSRDLARAVERGGLFGAVGLYCVGGTKPSE